MHTTNKSIVADFIEEIWNQGKMEKLEHYLSAGFTDHSLPPGLPANKEGTKQWITGTGKSFEHKTIIDEILCEDNKVMLKIKMQLKHIGTWRDIEPTFAEINVVGYRYFQLSAGRITAHWGLIDGNAIENQLRETFRGCKIQR